jgi:hypothetical protein
VGGKPVYATEEFSDLDPPTLPVMPEWSPVARFGGYARSGVPTCASIQEKSHQPFHIGCCVHLPGCAKPRLSTVGSLHGLWGTLGCDCFAF